MDLNPQQQEFLANYTNPNSETFGNARQSALKANYSQEYADNIMALMPDWLSDNIGNMKRLRKAEKVLDRTLEMIAIDEEGNLDNQLLKTQNDVAKFIASTVGKKIYSTRNEVSGPDGSPLAINIVKYGDSNTPSRISTT